MKLGPSRGTTVAAFASSLAQGAPLRPSSVVLDTPRAAYVHVPFCRQRCHYCDFTIVVTGDHVAESSRNRLHRNYFDALLQEIAVAARKHPRRENLRSVYFGGGTPSLADVADIGRVLDALDGSFGLDAHCEVTLEMDPGTFDLEKARGFRAAGVNRASIGAQTFDQSLLDLCGRAHSVHDTYVAVENVQAAGLHNFSMDLIGGLPTQGLDQFQASLEELTKLAPTHASVYDLIVEDGTKFSRVYQPGEPPLPSEDIAAQMYTVASETLKAAGYNHYETSNFAIPGFESAHNQTYWRNEPYHGYGLGATSFVDGARFKRSTTMRSYLSWVSNSETAGAEEREEARAYTFQDEVEETIMLQLRTAGGVSFESLATRFGEDIARNVFSTLALNGSDLVVVEPGSRARLTSPAGFLVQNSIIAEVLSNLPFPE